MVEGPKSIQSQEGEAIIAEKIQHLDEGCPMIHIRDVYVAGSGRSLSSLGHGFLAGEIGTVCS